MRGAFFSFSFPLFPPFSLVVRGALRASSGLHIHIQYRTEKRDTKTTKACITYNVQPPTPNSMLGMSSEVVWGVLEPTLNRGEGGGRGGCIFLSDPAPGFTLIVRDCIFVKLQTQ